MYKCYNVYALQRYSNAAEVQLGVSSKKIDVTPYSNPNLKQTSNKFWKVFQPKPITLNLESITECFLSKSQQENSTAVEDKSLFKINYFNGHSIHTLKFESTSDIASKIVNKINYLMQMRNTNSRKRNELLKVKK